MLIGDTKMVTLSFIGVYGADFCSKLSHERQVYCHHFTKRMRTKEFAFSCAHQSKLLKT